MSTSWSWTGALACAALAAPCLGAGPAGEPQHPPRQAAPQARARPLGAPSPVTAALVTALPGRIRTGAPDAVPGAAHPRAPLPNRRVVVESVAELVGRGAGPGGPLWLHLFLEEGGEVRAWHVPVGEPTAEGAARLRPWGGGSPRWTVREAAWMSVPLRRTGLHRLTVAVSSLPGVERPEGLPARERAGARPLELDVPAASPRHRCRLWTSSREEAVQPGAWRLADARLDCEWE